MIHTVGLLLIAVGFAEPRPSMYCGGRNVQASDGAIQLARQWDVVFQEDFERGLAGWKISNYEGTGDWLF